MPVPTTFADLSTTIASNSPAGSDNVFPDLDNYIRALAGMLASVSANSGNGWTSPYLALLGGTVSGSTTFSGAVTLSGSVSGAALTNYLAAPAAIGGTTPAAGAFTTLSASGAVTLSGGTANGVPYLNGSKVLTSGSALSFNGTNFGIGIATGAATLDVTGTVNSLQARFGNIATRGLEISTTTVNGTNDAGSILNARGAADGTLIIQLDSVEKARFNGSDFLHGGTSTGASGIGLNNTLNYSIAEGSGASYANLFRQTSSGATILANGYKRSATANGFASSLGSSWAKTAIGLGVNTGAISFYADAAATVANGTDATPTERVRFASGGEAYFIGVGTTASAANAFINNASSPVNQLLRSTSSLRYKKDIEPVAAARVESAMQGLRPIWYRSKAEADNKAWSWYGLIAEEVAEVEPRLVHWSYAEEDYQDAEVEVEVLAEVDGEMRPVKQMRTERVLKDGAELRPDGVQYERLAVLLLAEVQALRARVAALEAAK